MVPQVAEPVAWIDPQGVVRRTEGAIGRVLGQPGLDVVGRHIDSLTHPDDFAAVTAFLDHCSQDAKTVQPVEFRPRHLDEVWVSMKAVGGRREGDVHGQGSVVELVDVSARRRAETELRKTSELVRTLVDVSPLAIVIEDRAGCIRLWNGAAERLFGWTAAEIAGRPNPTIPARSAVERENLRSRVLKGEAFTGLESERVTRSGRIINASITTAPLQHQESDGTHLMEVVSDITEQQQLESQLRQAQKMEAVGRLAGGIAHDFNNLLTVITGHAEMLLDTPQHDADDALRAEIGQIREAGQRAAALTHQLLAFSRAQVLQPTVINLGDAVAEMVPMLRRLIGEDIDVTFKPGADLQAIKADPAQVGQVIMNLALNARDAMPAGGRLTLETSNVELDEAYGRTHMPVVPGPYVMLAVSDNGVGMDRETQARVFEPFFTTKEKGHGTGLGLATVYGIVRQSWGYIWVYSEPSHGTSFKVYLPSISQPVVADGQRRLRRAPQVGGSETILVVEDEGMIRQLVRQVLTRLGYQVIDARNGEEAITVARQHPGPIDLMLTDLVMPGMSTLELASGFGELRPHARILFMSGYTDHAAVRNSLLNPDRAFLQKPFAPNRLAHKVREVLDRAVGGPASAVGSIDDVGPSGHVTAH